MYGSLSFINFLKIAVKSGVSADAVKNVIIWGNHSNTQFPDAAHATVTVNGATVSAYDAVKDDHWLKNDFIKVTQFTFFLVVICIS